MLSRRIVSRWTNRTRHAYITHRRASSSAASAASECPFKQVPQETQIDTALVRDILRHPAALAHCPFAQRLVTTSDQAASANDVAVASVPSHAEALFARTVRELKAKRHYRTFRYLKRIVGEHPYVEMAIPKTLIQNTTCSTCETECSCTEIRTVVNWCSNDYLAMGHNPHIIDSMHESLDLEGAGAGGTRNISGSQQNHKVLEEKLAKLIGHESALLFGSCYGANIGVMQTLEKVLPADTLILSDQENHASLVQGIRASRMNKVVFRHNDVEHLEELLSAQPKDRTKVVVFESVYSMSGTVAPCKEILDLCEKYNALSFIDEVHAVGLYGKNGSGLLDELGLRGKASIVSGTLGKAFGVIGGFITSSHALIDCIRSLAPSFIFTSALNPPLVAGAIASLEHSEQKAGLAERSLMRSLASNLQTRALENGIPVMSTESHITPIFVGDSAKCREISDELLLKHSIYVQPIQYPSVPQGEALLRFTCSPKHTNAQIDSLVSSLVPIFERHNLLQEKVESTQQQKQQKDVSQCPYHQHLQQS